MKALALALFLLIPLSAGKAQKSKCVPTSKPRDAQVRLQLTTSVAETQYSVYYSSKSLNLTLNLDYRNVGTRPILLDKKSSVVYRRVVSKNIKAASACKYLYDASSHFIGEEPMKAAGFRSSFEPERSEFITLEPGESLRLKRVITLSLYTGTKDTKDNLHPGNYVLLVRVAAWFYYADPAEWEQKWGNQAYLWSENVTSEPMPFTVEKR